MPAIFDKLEATMRSKRTSACLAAATIGICYGQARYDLLLQGGHVIDAKNGISAIRDVGMGR